MISLWENFWIFTNFNLKTFNLWFFKNLEKKLKKWKISEFQNDFWANFEFSTVFDWGWGRLLQKLAAGRQQNGFDAETGRFFLGPLDPDGLKRKYSENYFITFIWIILFLKRIRNDF